MSLRNADIFSAETIRLLRHSYGFLMHQWQHSDREAIPDEGFELQFRQSCVRQLDNWIVSQHREMQFGCGAATASGVFHEIDVVLRSDTVIGVFELKNQRSGSPGKNSVVVFFAKILDYLLANPSLLKREIVAAFMTSQAMENSALAACLGLGIHPLFPGTRPIPVLVHNARLMLAELDNGLSVPPSVRPSVNDLCAVLNRLTLQFSSIAISERLDSFSDSSILVHALPAPPVSDLCDDLRLANAETARLVALFKAAKAGGAHR